MTEILVWPFRQVFRLLAPVKAAWNEELSKHHFGIASNIHRNDNLSPSNAYLVWREAFAERAQAERTRSYNERQDQSLAD